MLFVASLSSHPSALLTRGLPALAGRWSGFPRSLHRTVSPFRLSLSPDSCVDAVFLKPTGITSCVAVLAEADSYRRPVDSDEGSVENSHMLVMWLLLLALSPRIARREGPSSRSGY